MRFLALLIVASTSTILGGCSLDPDPLVGDFDVQLSGGYLLVRTDVDDVEVVHMRETAHHKGVPAKVVEIAWNADFILAKQQELKDRGSFPGDNLPVPVPGKFWYWIVDTRQGDSDGPMAESEFLAKVRSIGLEGLKMQKVTELNNRRYSTR